MCNYEMQVPAFSHFHIFIFPHLTSGSSSFGRAVAFQASGGRFEPGLPLISFNCLRRQWKSRCSSVVEHFLGREEVVSSILTNGSLSDACPDYFGSLRLTKKESSRKGRRSVSLFISFTERNKNPNPTDCNKS